MTESILTEAHPPISDEKWEDNFTWSDIFSEGEKRIKARFLDAMLRMNARDRPRMLTQRETVQRRIAEALEKGNARKLRRALKEQVSLLARLA